MSAPGFGRGRSFRVAGSAPMNTFVWLPAEAVVEISVLSLDLYHADYF